MTDHEPNMTSASRRVGPRIRRGGRRRRFDINAVLDAALKTFWRKGYSATSLDDLVDATGVKRPSLYLAFGSKERLYLQAVARFRDRQSAQIAELLDLENGQFSVSERIRLYLDLLIKTYVGNETYPKGDAIMCSSLADTSEHDSIRQVLTTYIEASDRMLEGFFQKARVLNLIGPHAEPEILSHLFGGIVLNLQQRARVGASAEELTEFSSRAASFLLGAT